MSILEAHDIAAEFRQLQPERHLALEHAALAPIIARAGALAGDHQDESSAILLRRAQKMEQFGMRLALGPAVQVDARIERNGAAGQTLFLPPVERLEPGRRLG